MVDLRKIELGDNQNVAIKVGGNLHAHSWDETGMGVMSYHDEFIRIETEETGTRVLCSSDCDLFLPKTAILKVEKVGGDAYLRNILTSLLIQKVGGDLTILDVPVVEIDRIGGDCRLKNINERLIVHRMSGDLSAIEINGSVQIETVRGDVRMAGCSGELVIQSYGDIRLGLNGNLTGDVQLRTKGDLRLHVIPGMNAIFNIETPSRDITIDLGGERDFISEKIYSLKFGSGERNAAIYASGDILISDKPLNLPNLNQLFERISHHWERVEQTGERRFDHDLWGKDAAFRAQMSAERSAERARKAAERIERRAQKKVKLIARLEDEIPDIDEQIRSRLDFELPKIEEKISEAMNSAFKQSGFSGFENREKWASPAHPIPPQRTTPPTPPHPPITPSIAFQREGSTKVTDDERKLILQMVQDSKITPEQAVELLKTISGE